VNGYHFLSKWPRQFPETFGFTKENKGMVNRSHFLSACGGLSFALSGLGIKEVMSLFPA